MEIIKYPARNTWAHIVERPHLDARMLGETVSDMLADIRCRGDEAVREYVRRFQGAEIGALEVSPEEMAEAEAAVSSELKEAIAVAGENISRFHASQTMETRKVETTPGVICWQKAVPLLINNLAWGIGFSMYSVIMGHLGTDAVAANGIANISKNLVVCFCLGLGNAGSIIVGNRLGADRLQEAKEAGGTLTRTAIIAGVVSGLVLIALSPFITKMVDLTPTARGYLQKMLLICSYYIAGKSVNCMTIGGIFAAGGDSKFGMLCDSVTLWCITVPLGCICAFILKLPVMVVYFVLNLDEIIKLPVVYKHYKKYKWIKNLT